MQIPQTRTRGVMVMLLVLMPNVVEALTALLLPAPALMLNGKLPLSLPLPLPLPLPLFPPPPQHAACHAASAVNNVAS